MKQEDKELLLVDLAARLPYGVKIELMPITRGKCTALTPIILRDYFISDDVNYLPYLRPMSSMTEEEENEFKKIFELELKAIESPEGHTIESAASSAFAIDFYNKYHFDYRGLIERDLAIEAPKGMYDYD